MHKRIRIGFDLGNSSLKIAVHRKSAPEFYQLELPEHLMEHGSIAMPHAFSAFLKKTRRELHLPGGPAGLILPDTQVICRQVSMPAMTVDQLMLNLPYEFSDFIRDEPHQYVCDYALCEPDEAERKRGDTPAELVMMAAAVKKKQVQEYIRMFADGGFALHKMLPQEMTLIQLAKAVHEEQPNAPREYCFIDLGYQATRIFVGTSDRIQVSRRIAAGGAQLAEAVADVLNIDAFLAGTYLRSNHQDIQNHPSCTAIYEHIAVEALKLVNFYHFTYRQNQLRGVYLIGGGAAIKPLCSLLQETLNLPILPVEQLGLGTKANSACTSAAGLLVQEKEG